MGACPSQSLGIEVAQTDVDLAASYQAGDGDFHQAAFDPHQGGTYQQNQLTK
jgi:hypothetical protein